MDPAEFDEKYGKFEMIAIDNQTDEIVATGSDEDIEEVLSDDEKTRVRLEHVAGFYAAAETTKLMMS